MYLSKLPRFRVYKTNHLVRPAIENKIVPDGHLVMEHNRVALFWGKGTSNVPEMLKF